MQDDRYAGIRALMVFAGAVAAALLIVAASPHKAKAGPLSLELEASFGGALTNDQLSSGSSKLDLSQTGLLGGVGAALVYENDKIIAGLLGRYTYMHESGDVLSATIASHNLMEVAAKFGVRMTAATNVYGLAGWGWKDMDLSSLSTTLGTKITNGPMVGGGIEHQIAKSNWFVRSEYEHFFFDSPNIGSGVKLTPDENIVRVGLAYRFGGGAKLDPFAASGLLPEAPGCDPKLASCPRLK